jgi:hypothetical protein
MKSLADVVWKSAWFCLVVAGQLVLRFGHAGPLSITVRVPVGMTNQTANLALLDFSERLPPSPLRPPRNIEALDRAGAVVEREAGGIISIAAVDTATGKLERPQKAGLPCSSRSSQDAVEVWRL